MSDLENIDESNQYVRFSNNGTTNTLTNRSDEKAPGSQNTLMLSKEN